METVYIVLIVVVGIVILVFLVRDRLTSFGASLKGKRGESELGGGVRMTAESSKQPPPTESPRQPPSTRVSGTRMIGKKQKINIREKGAQVDKNLMKGEEQEINIDNPNEPKKSENRE